MTTCCKENADMECYCKYYSNFEKLHGIFIFLLVDEIRNVSKVDFESMEKYVTASAEHLFISNSYLYAASTSKR